MNQVPRSQQVAQDAIAYLVQSEKPLSVAVSLDDPRIIFRAVKKGIQVRVRKLTEEPE